MCLHVTQNDTEMRNLIVCLPAKYYLVWIHNLMIYFMSWALHLSLGGPLRNPSWGWRIGVCGGSRGQSGHPPPHYHVAFFFTRHLYPARIFWTPPLWKSWISPWGGCNGGRSFWRGTKIWPKPGGVRMPRFVQTLKGSSIFSQDSKNGMYSIL